MAAGYGQVFKRNIVRSGSRSHTEGNGGSSFTGKLAILNGNVVCVIVLAGGVDLALGLGARHVDEGIVVRRSVIGKLDILNSQSVSVIVSAVAVDIELAGYGLAVAVDSQVQAGLLMDNGNFRNVRKQRHRHVADQFMGRIQGILKRGI